MDTVVVEVPAYAMLASSTNESPLLSATPSMSEAKVTESPLAGRLGLAAVTKLEKVTVFFSPWSTLETKSPSSSVISVTLPSVVISKSWTMPETKESAAVFPAAGIPH